MSIVGCVHTQQERREKATIPGPWSRKRVSGQMIPVNMFNFRI